MAASTATIAIKTIDGSGFVNGKNAAGGFTISRTSNDTIARGLAGLTVTVALNGKTYMGTIANNGTWSVYVGAADLAVLTDGQSYAVTASAVDNLLLTSAVCGLKPAHANSR